MKGNNPFQSLLKIFNLFILTATRWSFILRFIMIFCNIFNQRSLNFLVIFNIRPCHTHIFFTLFPGKFYVIFLAKFLDIFVFFLPKYPYFYLSALSLKTRIRNFQICIKFQTSSYVASLSFAITDSLAIS